MHLTGLCFLLPQEPHDVHPLDHVSAEKHSPSRGRGCGTQVLALLRHLGSHFHDVKWSSFCHCRHPARQGSEVFHDMEGVRASEKVVGGNNPRIFSFSELYIGTNGFCDDEVLGSGGFGKVFRAVLPSDGTVVAVKCLAEKGEPFEKTFVAELMAVAQLRHRNLVRLRGWCVHEEQLLLVYDYMPNRSLDRILFRRGENSAVLSWERRRKIVRGLAAALYYLHEQLETQIIHRDVKTSNVMLDSHYNARLGDFGLARWLEHELQMGSKSESMRHHQFRLGDNTRIGGTIGYLPPESFQKRSMTTAKSDVFSFGIVVLEVVSGRRAVDLTYPDDQIILLDWIRKLSDEGKLLRVGDNRLPDGTYSLSEMEHLIHLGLLCTLHNPHSRPNMKWIVEALSGQTPSKLPALPSFQSHPLYISLSSASPSETGTSTTTTTTATAATTTTNTASFSSSNYVTAAGETIYLTAAENGRSSETSSSNSSRHQQNNIFPMVHTPQEISYKDIASATNNFSESQRVAELDFGTAYYGFLDNRYHVLVKRLGMKTCPALRARFSNELHNLGRLHHRNLVQLRGWCTEQGEMLVVYDYSSNRLLSHLLFHHDAKKVRSTLLWRHRYNIIKSLASAILYLHEEWDEQVIHRSITSSAIIIDADMNPRLSSFALAEFLTRNEHGQHHVTDPTRSVRGIFGYISPEYVESGEATPMTDVYSFGMVVLEVVTGQMAVDFRCPGVLLVKRVREFAARKRALQEMADWRLDGEYDKEELMRLIKLGMACTSSKPELRPSIGQIVSILDGNEVFFTKERQRMESNDEWKGRNACSLSLIKRIQALGIQ